MKPQPEGSAHTDRTIIFVALLLIGVGLVQVYSASYIYATERYNNGLHFFLRQSGFAVLGLTLMYLMTRIPYRWVERWGFMIWVLGVVGVIATFVPGIGVKVGGAHRWLQLPFGFRFEPSELIKIGYPILMATLIAKDTENWGVLKWPLRLAIVGLPLFFLLKQPDFGSFFISVFIIFCLLFAFGLKWRYIIATAALVVPAFYFLIFQVEYRWNRVLAFLDPWSDPDNKGFQVIQSMISFHSGGWSGVGLGQGQGKLFFLPEAHTDFTLAILGEELGFVGVFTILFLYGYLVLRSFQIAGACRDRFAQAACLGIAVYFGISTFVNSGVAMGLLPTKGLTLPFLSYGGSSLVASCLALGLLLNIDRAQNIKQKRFSSFYKI